MRPNSNQGAATLNVEAQSRARLLQRRTGALSRSRGAPAAEAHRRAVAQPLRSAHVVEAQPAHGQACEAPPLARLVARHSLAVDDAKHGV